MIKVLSDETIQKIAAGEVVERPASVVKELVENSIDAQADEIIVEIKNGGKSYIKVSDNGQGIGEEDVEKAFLRHSTSKIDVFEDLYKIYTMGFRGEALASIVAVSNLEIFTKTDQQKTGSFLHYDNNRIVEKKKIGMNTGTIIEVRDLFAYLPVRRKFLGSDMAEANRISSLMYSFAIGHNDISFTYIRDNREIFRTNKLNSQLENLSILFGKDYTDNTIAFEASNDRYSISGYMSNNKFYKGNRSMQYIYVNNRYIENKDLVESVESQYHSIIPNGRFPAFQLFIETDPANIDINISPNKQKIKFGFEEGLHDLIKETVNEKILESQNIIKIDKDEKDDGLPNFYGKQEDSDLYQKILDAYKTPFDFEVESENEDFSTDDQGLVIKDEDSDFQPIFDLLDEEDSYEDTFNEDPGEQLKLGDFKDDQDEEFTKPEDLNYKATIFNKYILFERPDRKLLIINQTAANERLIYDRLSNNMEADTVENQELISPIIIDLPGKDYDIFDNNRQLFEDFGFIIDDFGKNTLAIRSVPYFIDQPSDSKLFFEILDGINSSQSKDSKKDYLLKKSVGLSINKNKDYDQREAINLYKSLIKSSNPYASAHGKATMFLIDEDDLEGFLR